MKRKTRIVVFFLIIVIAIGIPVGKNIHDNSNVTFADENMGRVIRNTLWGFPGETTIEEITYKEIRKIDSLDIGYSGYYTTLSDLRYCTELKELIINGGIDKNAPAYYINQGKVNKENTPEDMRKLQQELEEVLPKLKKLERVMLSSWGGETWSSLDFFKGCEKLEYVDISRCEATDYSVLKSCKSLKKIVIGHSDITNADNLIGLENIESIHIYDAPLGDNPDEVKKLQEAYPNADISCTGNKFP